MDNPQLREEFTLYRAVFDTMQEGVLVQDTQGYIIMCNPAAEKILGWPAEQLQGRSVTKSPWGIVREDGSPFPPDQRPAAQALRTGKPQSNVTMGLQKPDGTTMWVVVNCQPLIHEGEAVPYGAASTFCDVTDRREAEAHTHWLARFPAENPNPILRVDPQGVIIYANPSSQTLRAAWRVELGQIVPAAVFDKVDAALQNQASQTMEVQLDTQVLALTLSPDAEGTYVNIYGLDITDRKRAELALQDSEETMRRLLEAAPIGVVVVDDHGRIALVNDSAARIFGYTRAELTTEPLELLIPEASRPAHAQHYKTFVADPKVRPMGSGLHLTARHNNGASFPVEISLGYVHTAHGVLTIAFIIDMTQQHELEHMRESMIHTMVHDLRNPLGAIYTGLAFLATDAKDVLDTHHAYILNVATRNSERMLDLVNGILDVNQLESGQLPVQPKSFAIQQLATETLASLRPLADDKGLHVHNNIAPGLPDALADETLIERVLQNLIGNAIKFTPPQGTITITARHETDDKLRISVSDDGPGIEPELRDRLFQAFVTGRHRQRGNGLGLAFCKLALDAHSETIAVESEPGQGTTFTFTLPVNRP